MDHIWSYDVWGPKLKTRMTLSYGHDYNAYIWWGITGIIGFKPLNFEPQKWGFKSWRLFYSIPWKSGHMVRSKQ